MWKAASSNRYFSCDLLSQPPFPLFFPLIKIIIYKNTFRSPVLQVSFKLVVQKLITVTAYRFLTPEYIWHCYKVREDHSRVKNSIICSIFIFTVNLFLLLQVYLLFWHSSETTFQDLNVPENTQRLHSRGYNPLNNSWDKNSFHL